VQYQNLDRSGIQPTSRFSSALYGTLTSGAHLLINDLVLVKIGIERIFLCESLLNHPGEALLIEPAVFYRAYIMMFPQFPDTLLQIQYSSASCFEGRPVP
jgi:hypothetical protein